MIDTDTPNDELTLIDKLLADQRELTAVARFARQHEQHEIPAQAKYYRDLIPLSLPKKGQQYAFEVDLDKCSGCKACVTACHSLNGLDENETWRDVGLLVSVGDDVRRLTSKSSISQSLLTSSPTAFQQHVTTACHHCVDPACLNGCPVLAYEKDSVTGIVHHLDDQCIGCSYCVMKCPYEVPQYHKKKGIVRKCDMCSSRLLTNEAPACVQACPNEAIRITFVEPTKVREEYRTKNSSFQTTISPFIYRNPFLPDSPNPTLTLPTTRYISKHKQSNLVAADSDALRLDPPHWPLIVMLILTQAAAGLFIASALLSPTISGPSQLNFVGLSLLVIGLTAAVFHLGQPLKAWRGFLGWRKSWLSRELIIFNFFAAAAVAMFAKPNLAPFVATLGCASVFASAMVYVDTHRPFWSARLTFGNFFGTTLLLGATFAAVVLGWNGNIAAAQPFAIGALLIRTALFIWRRLELRAALRNPTSAIHFNARVIRELIVWTTPARTGLFLASTVFGVLAIANVAHLVTVWASLAALTMFSSEIIGRYIFFAASASKRMPGGLTA